MVFESVGVIFIEVGVRSRDGVGMAALWNLFDRLKDSLCTARS